MKIYVAHSKKFDYLNELYKPLRESNINHDHIIILPHEHSNEQYDSREELKTCDYVIAEVSSPSFGVGIELGWASLYNVSIICINKTSSIVSDSLKEICNIFIEYTNKEELIEKIISALN